MQSVVGIFTGREALERAARALRAPDVAGDRVSTLGLPKDELLVYEEALRRGRFVAIALVDSDERARRARDILDRHGAETVDAARESWRVGLTEPGPARGETAA